MTTFQTRSIFLSVEIGRLFSLFSYLFCELQIMPKLLSVNVSLPKDIQHKGKTVSTGIFKKPIEGRVKVRTLNIDGDGQADLIGHGGEMRAVYVYSHDNYPHWAKELGRNDFTMGQFGENFTVEGMSDHEIHIGDQFRIGTVLFEVSQPRVPCYKLAIKMKEEGFYSQILKSGRLGFYFRVIEEGEVGAGDEIQPVKGDPHGMNISEVNALMYFEKENYQGFRDALKIKALSPGWRSTFEDRLSKEKTTTKAYDKYRTLAVEKIVTESKTITSFYLTADDGKPLPTYLPGQFLPVKLDIPGQYKEVFRTYTLSDSPNKDYYRLTIKREPAPADIPNAYPGVSSNYFHDQVDVGAKIQASKPRGKFYLKGQENPILLLSAGVGVTPMISMLNWLVEMETSRKVWFVHGTRNGQEHAMNEHVRDLAHDNQNIQVYIKYSQPGAQDKLGEVYEEIGYVDIDLIKRLAPGKDCDFYVCGPTPFMKSIFNELTDWGVAETSINYEFFGPAAEMGARKKVTQPQRLAEITECCNDVEINFVKSGIKTNWNPSFGSILDLAEAEGLSPDFSCRSGICQTCVCDLKEGEVDYSPEPLDTPAPGTVLICCSKPRTNLVIDL